MAYPPAALIFLAAALMNGVLLGYLLNKLCGRRSRSWRHGEAKSQGVASQRARRGGHESPGQGSCAAAKYIAVGDFVVVAGLVASMFDNIVYVIAPITGFSSALTGLRDTSTLLDALVRPFFLVVGAHLVTTCGDLLSVDSEMRDVLKQRTEEVQSGALPAASGAARAGTEAVSIGDASPSTDGGAASHPDVASRSPAGGFWDGGTRSDVLPSVESSGLDSAALPAVDLLESPAPASARGGGAGYGATTGRGDSVTDVLDGDDMSTKRQRRAERKARRSRATRRRRRCIRNATRLFAWIGAMVLAMAGLARFDSFTDSLRHTTALGIPVLAPALHSSGPGAWLDFLPRATEIFWLLLIGGCLLYRLRFPWLCALQLAVFVGLGYARQSVTDDARFFIVSGCDLVLNASLVFSLKHLASVAMLKARVKAGLRPATEPTSNAFWRADAAGPASGSGPTAPLLREALKRGDL